MTGRRQVVRVLVCVTALSIRPASPSGYQAPPAQQDVVAAASRKVAQWVLDRTAEGRTAEFLVVLSDAADLRPAAALEAKRDKGRFVRDALFAHAKEAQAPLLDWLRSRRIDHRPFYIVNAIWARGGRRVVLDIAARRDVARIEGNPRIRGIEPAPLPPDDRNVAEAPHTIEPGVNYIHAPEVWSQGFTGQGIVIGGADTGVRWDHAALKNHYRGWNGSSTDHNYSWHDSVHGDGGFCGSDSPEPCDDHGHGTHTIGTAIGDDGGANQIGVAPGAKFIACRNMDQGFGTPATYIECMEWFLAPYPVGGTPAQGDPSRAPDLTTNSWGCPPSEGCSPGTLQAAIEAQRAAGIMFVASAGNGGPSCSTVVDPPSIYDAAYTVGGFDADTGTIASFSSLGPVTIDGSSRRKPDITAPGVVVRSASRFTTTGYTFLSGTSMAAPHVSGAIALLWSAHPELRHQIALTENLLNDAAADVPLPVAGTSCTTAEYPNNVYGFGRLDVKAAVDLAAASISPAATGFASGGGSGSVTVTAPGGVAWQAFAGDPWITVTSALTGAGNGFVSYSVAANAGAARTGTLIVAGRTLTVIQSAPSTLTVASVTPSARRTSGGQPIVLTGSFADLSSVAVGGVAASWSFTNGTTEITVTTPPHAAGSVHITLTPAGGGDYIRVNAFAFLPTTFTDDTLVANVTPVRTQHAIELRQAVDAVRAVAGQGPAPWIDPALVPGVTPIKAAHVLELRAYLESAAAELGYSAGSYTDPSLDASTPIKRVHIEQLRQRIRDLAD
jgi:subtilisin family serine protease